MREIKFRAWDKEKKILYKKIWNLQWCFGGIRFAWDDYENSDGETMITDLKDGNFDLMQSTGLKDKNGKEIYEGDIVKYENLNMDVCWRNYGWHLFYRKLGEVGYLVPPYGGSVDGYKHMEIIGNIWENKDLLI